MSYFVTQSPLMELERCTLHSPHLHITHIPSNKCFIALAPEIEQYRNPGMMIGKPHKHITDYAINTENAYGEVFYTKS